jgi:glyoxylase I family protein
MMVVGDADVILPKARRASSMRACFDERVAVGLVIVLPRPLEVSLVGNEAALRRRVGAKKVSMSVVGLHHVALPCRDLATSQAFYRDVIGLQVLERPPIPAPGLWFSIGPAQLHLFHHPDGTFRRSATVDFRDTHMAIAVMNFAEVLERLTQHGYSTKQSEDHPRHLRLGSGAAGFAQVFLRDPDHHVIELNEPNDFIRVMRGPR